MPSDNASHPEKIAEPGKVIRPDSVDPQIWEDNQRWLQLMNAQAEQHRHSRDPRLYRQSAKKGLITPTSDKN